VKTSFWICTQTINIKINRSYFLISENGQSAGNIKYIYIIYRGSSETARYTPYLYSEGEDTVQIIAERL
jgi:hypothetical protein